MASSNGHKIQRVLPLLLELEKDRNDYIPQAISIGPYHHGEPRLAFVEAYKPRAVELFVGPKDEQFYYDLVVGIIGEVRDCYAWTSTLNFSDADLALMMLRDAAFIIIYMQICGGKPADPSNFEGFKMFHDLGNLTLTIVWRDLVLFDNQIPLQVIKLLIDSRYGEGHHQPLLDRFMRNVYRRKATAWERMWGEPLHLLEAYHRLVVKQDAAPPPTCCSWLSCSGADKQNGINDDPEIGASPPVSSLIRRLLKALSCKNRTKKPKSNNDDGEYYGTLVHSFRTVKDLKAKGIFFKPSPSQSLKDVSFRSHFFYARLELPEWFVSPYTKAFFKNLLAFEMSPNSPTRWEVASYINLMKSLIEGPDDVKELREKRILFNMLGSDQEVLSVYKDIDIHGVYYPHVYKEVKDQIEAHYSSSVKRWMAELFHNNFRSPWTAIAFLAAFSVLAIAAAQLYYAVHPPPN